MTRFRTVQRATAWFAIARKRSICLVVCLILASTLFVARPFLLVKDCDQLWPANDDSRLLARDALEAARGSVLETMHALSEAYQRQLQITGRDRLSAKLEQLQASLENHHVADMDRVDICTSLAGKRVAMIGGEHVYRLHIRLLQHRERAEGKPFPCPYHELCTHHHICLPRQHVQHGTPSPPRYVKSPTARELIDTESAVVRYIVSDTLCPVLNESSWEYTSPFVDPETGVRLRETYWLAAARKADVVILGRGPLSAPGETYAGNWSFLQNMPDYVGVSRFAALAGIFIGYDDGRASETVPRSLDVLNAAVHLTVTRFLPDVFQLLRSVKRDVRPTRRKRLIWPSSWYRLPGRGIARSAIQSTDCRCRQPRSAAEDIFVLQLTAMLNADKMQAALLEDPWTLLFNAQGMLMEYFYLQSMVLRVVLPRNGIVFLPLDIPWIRGNWAAGRKHGCGATADSDLQDRVVETFVTGMDHVLEYLQ